MSRLFKVLAAYWITGLFIAIIVSSCNNENAGVPGNVPMTVKTVVVNGCYYVMVDDTQGVAIVHAGNCKNH